jgi:hypothetical protein
MVTSVPWQLASSADLAKRPIRPDGPKVPPTPPRADTSEDTSVHSG